MMLKFMAWDKKQQCWVKDKQVKKCFNQYYNQPNYKVVMYSGINGIEGKEIYDRFFIKNKYGVTDFVKWNNGGFNLYRDGRFLCRLNSGLVYSVKYRVVGNEFENPELAKECL